jgi:TolB protein
MIVYPWLPKPRLPGYCSHCVAGLVLFLTAVLPVRADIIFTAKVAGPISNIYAVDDSGKIKKLTSDTNWRDLDPDWRSGWITYSTNREKEAKIDMYKTSEDYDVYVVKDNGKSLKQLTDSAYDEVVPKFSPDGKMIGYLHQPPSAKHEMIVIKRDGSGKRVVTTAEAIIDFSWSPDGKKIVYAPADGADSALMTVDVASDGEIQTLIKVSKEPAPAGAKNTDAFQKQVVSVQWSPDGDKVAYIMHPFEQGAVRRLHVFNLKTGMDTVVSVDGAQVQHPVVWSADGERLLYSALVGYQFYYDEKIHKKVYKGGMHIFLSSLAGDKAETRQLTNGDFLFKSPVFSPDEKQIAFLYADALAARTLKLKTMEIDGTDIRQWYDSVAQRSYLQWK